MGDRVSDRQPTLPPSSRPSSHRRQPTEHASTAGNACKHIHGKTSHTVSSHSHTVSDTDYATGRNTQFESTHLSLAPGTMSIHTPGGNGRHSPVTKQCTYRRRVRQRTPCPTPRRYSEENPILLSPTRVNRAGRRGTTNACNQ